MALGAEAPPPPDLMIFILLILRACTRSTDYGIGVCQVVLIQCFVALGNSKVFELATADTTGGHML